MKRTVLIVAMLLIAAACVFLQTTFPAARLATLMPTGAMLYLEAQDFGRLLHDWDASQVKADWLRSENHEVFSRSNLFSKLQGVYSEYGEAAGFVPGLKGLVEIAGTNSALALYEIRDVEFLYISRVSEPELMKSQLWAVRDKFQQRQAGGVAFYLRTDPASKRTVAFAFAKGYLFLGTRDDLVAQALELLAGGTNPSIASDRWYTNTVAAASNPGELRLVMNLESIVKSVYFRSYWIQRNVSDVSRHWAGLSDISRSDGNLVEDRVFLRAPDGAEQNSAVANSSSVSILLALVPPEAGVYKVSPVRDLPNAAALIVQKLIGTQPQRSRDWREAPSAIPEDQRAGSEADLETRIDEQPLPQDAGESDSVDAVRAMLEKAGTQTVLLVQSSSPLGGTFVQTPSVIALAAAQDWDEDSVRGALATASGQLWTTSQLGAAWTTATAGRYPVAQLDGLGKLMFSGRGKLLFLSNDPTLLAAVLDRTSTTPPAGVFTYAAGFRHAPERSNYERVMTALDIASGANGPGGAPTFFFGNLGSLSRTLSSVTDVKLTQQETGAATIQKVLYQVQK
jgi:hypothetical protein